MIRIAAAQDAPVIFDKQATLQLMMTRMTEASEAGVAILAFGETFLPGYPFWLSSTGGAEFNNSDQKDAFAAYHNASVRIDGPELAQLADLAKSLGIAVVTGIAESTIGAGSGSLYCTAVAIDPERGILPSHRKLMPTFEERLVWAPGDGHGLRVHELAGVRVGVLNCWENWLPQARHALYADGEQLHIALWPGAVKNTQDITRFVAQEGRVFVLSAGGVLDRSDIEPDFPLRNNLPDGVQTFHDGGSAIAAPDGSWLVAPVANKRGLITAEIDMNEVIRERQNFDCTGHYSRPDVFDVRVDRSRRVASRFIDDDDPAPST